MRISSAGITNVGQKRQNNEDSYLVNDRIGVYIVCDVFEQCSRARLETDQWLGAFVRAVFSILHSDDDAAVRQACFYVLGVMAAKCGHSDTADTLRLSSCPKCCARAQSA